MKPKTKDGTKLNLYVDKGIVALLDAMSQSQGLSRSVIVERLVRSNISSREKKVALAAVDLKLKHNHEAAQSIQPIIPPARKSRQGKVP